MGVEESSDIKQKNDDLVRKRNDEDHCTCGTH